MLNAEIQANLVRNKANKMVDKIQPYSINVTTLKPKSALKKIKIKIKELKQTGHSWDKNKQMSAHQTKATLESSIIPKLE